MHYDASHNTSHCDVMYCDVLWCDVLMMWCIMIYRDVMYCDVLLCNVLWCDILWCDVLWSDVLWFIVMYCDALWWNVLYCDVFLCDVLRDVMYSEMTLLRAPLCRPFRSWSSWLKPVPLDLLRLIPSKISTSRTLISFKISNDSNTFDKLCLSLRAYNSRTLTKV